MSKRLHAMLKSHSWNGKVEKLGLDEVFMDVTDIINYNLFCLNKSSLPSTFFHLSKTNPEHGFPCDLTRFAGCVERFSDEALDMENPVCVRLLLGSHLAHYLRTKLESDFGFTSTCGISTNKILSKLSGARNKPRNQTTLLALTDRDYAAFMDKHGLRQVPYIGSKTCKSLVAKIRPDLPPPDAHTHDCPITVADVRAYPGMSPALLESILGGPGAERGTGDKVWALLHGIDDTDVKAAGDVPTQISIEDTYREPLEDLDVITKELYKISQSLLRRMRVDLVAEDPNPHRPSAQRWIARPRVLRLSINAPISADQSYFSRTSRLVSEAVLPLLRKFASGKDHKWGIYLLNVCVTNMALTGSDSGTSPRGAKRRFAAREEEIDETEDDDEEEDEGSDCESEADGWISPGDDFGGGGD
ncbi:unnamed protein product [Parascedosporium putredinis]|uniref:UmuC domain-containing protein n=1 Tax=Parascedosporium putredinis TaxID=1442378 RepID=A0A9P1GVU0_9PEZI|nr:unnamed protein product [Parascedosporium putredinis]CAI7988816.1 unnamed protein product [Parascedosporium putredinis]